MQILDALVSGHFRERADGTCLFFPWKRLSKPRVLPIEEARRLRRRMGLGIALLVPVAIVAILLVQRLAASTGGPASLYIVAVVALLLAAFLLWYAVAVVAPTAGAPRGNASLGPAEATVRTLRNLAGRDDEPPTDR